MADAESQKQVEMKLRIWRDKLGKWEDEITVVDKIKVNVKAFTELIKEQRLKKGD